MLCPFHGYSHLPKTPLLLLGTVPEFPLQVLYLSSNCSSLALQHQLNREIVALFWCKYNDMTSEKRKRSLEFPRDLEFLPEPGERGRAMTTAACRDM